MRLNGWLYFWLRAPVRPNLRAQLGPGPDKYLPGWINIDANILSGKCDVWADLRHRLPFRDGTVAAMYSHHVVEHLPDLAFHFREAFRCLQPGGVYRVGGPDGDVAIRKFVEGDNAWFSDFPQVRRSIGGRFENYIFCGGEHLTILTRSFLEELMSDAGFINLRACFPAKETNYPELLGDCLTREYEWDADAPHTLIIEGQKPCTD